jgi:hypothetical protein
MTTVLIVVDKMADMLDVSSVEEIKEKEFDPRGQYSGIVKAVKNAGNGSASFFVAKLDATRSEYFIVSLDADNERIVGLKAFAVES